MSYGGGYGGPKGGYGQGGRPHLNSKPYLKEGGKYDPEFIFFFGKLLHTVVVFLIFLGLELEEVSITTIW